MPKSRSRVIAEAAQHRQILDSGETATAWVAGTDITNLSTSTNHREGANSLTFDKSGATVAAGSITRTFDAEKQLDINQFLQGNLRYWINLSALTDVASITLTIGESAANSYAYTTLDVNLATGWNEVINALKTPDATNGTGANWNSIGYLAVTVTLDASGDTLTDILVDMIEVYYDTSTELGAGSPASSTENSDTFIDLDGDNTAQVLKASSGKITYLQISNPNAALAYLQLFNTAAGSVTVGTTPPIQSYIIPVTGGFSEKVTITFDTAITYACTNEPAGNGDPAAGLVVNALFE